MTIFSPHKTGLDISHSPPDFAIVTERLSVGCGRNADQAAEIIRGIFSGLQVVWFEWAYDEEPLIARYAYEEELPFVS